MRESGTLEEGYRNCECSREMKWEPHTQLGFTYVSILHIFTLLIHHLLTKIHSPITTVSLINPSFVSLLVLKRTHLSLLFHFLSCIFCILLLHLLLDVATPICVLLLHSCYCYFTHCYCCCTYICYCCILLLCSKDSTSAMLCCFLFLRK